MSLYVRVFTNFYTHRKTARLRASMGDAAFWIVPRLWAYAAENQPDGDFSNYQPAEIAHLIGYTGDAQAMLQAMLGAGFMDSDPLRIHDWEEHNGYHQSFAERARNAAKAKWLKHKQAKQVEAKTDPEQEISPTPPLIRKEMERKGKETSIASSMRQAEPSNAPSNACSSGVGGDELPPYQFPQGFPTTEAAAIAAAMCAGVPNDFVIETWNKALGRGGCDSRDVPVRHWIGHLKTEWKYHQERIEKEKHAANRPNGKPNPRNAHVSEDLSEQSARIVAFVARQQKGAHV